MQMPTRDARLAASMMIFNVPVTVKKMMEARSGRERTTFHMGTAPVGSFQPEKVKKDWQSGKLERDEPGHPFVVAMTGQWNRERILDLQEQGKPLRLVPSPGRERYAYREGDTGLPGYAGHPQVIKTGDLKAAAALGVVGGGLLWLEGPRGQRNYYLPVTGEEVVWGGRPERMCLGSLLKGWREGSLPMDAGHPFVIAMAALCARERLLDAVRSQEREVVVKHPDTGKMATFYESMTGKGMARVERFLTGQ
jgi:hypothetical protein